MFLLSWELLSCVQEDHSPCCFLSDILSPLGCCVCSDVTRDSEYGSRLFFGGIYKLIHFLDALTMKQRRVPESVAIRSLVLPDIKGGKVCRVGCMDVLYSPTKLVGNGFLVVSE